MSLTGVKLSGQPVRYRPDFPIQNMKVFDLIGRPNDLVNTPFCAAPDEEQNFELASATLLCGKKKGEARTLPVRMPAGAKGEA